MNLMRKLNQLNRIDFSNPYQRLYQIKIIFEYFNTNFYNIHVSNSSSHQRFIRMSRQCATNLLREIDTIVFDDQFALKTSTTRVLHKYLDKNKALTSPNNPQEP